jgi:hypothetical protein
MNAVLEWEDLYRISNQHSIEWMPEGIVFLTGVGGPTCGYLVQAESLYSFYFFGEDRRLQQLRDEKLVFRREDGVWQLCVVPSTTAGLCEEAPTEL